MKQKEYLKAVFQKLNEKQEITCEDCGKTGFLNHAIIDHDRNRVKIICNNCFLNGYKDLLYSNGKGNA